MNAVLCLLVLVPGDRESDARAALALASATKPAHKAMAYDEAYRLALAERKPLIVFVGVPCRPIEGCVTCADRPGLHFAKVNAVEVSKPEGTFLSWLAELPGNALDSEILDSLKPPVQQSSAVPQFADQVAGLYPPATGVPYSSGPARPLSVPRIRFAQAGGC